MLRGVHCNPRGVVHIGGCVALPGPLKPSDPICDLGEPNAEPSIDTDRGNAFKASPSSKGKSELTAGFFIALLKLT